MCIDISAFCFVYIFGSNNFLENFTIKLTVNAGLSAVVVVVVIVSGSSSGGRLW